MSVISSGKMCVESDSTGKYRVDYSNVIGYGEEATVYGAIGMPNIAIKAFESINNVVLPGMPTGEYISKLHGVLSISKRVGDLGIGPKVWSYQICEKTIVLSKDTEQNKRNWNALKSRATVIKNYTKSGFKENPEFINFHKQLNNPTETRISFKSPVAYLVMDKIDGFSVSRDQLDSYMDAIYETYKKLYAKRMILLDLHLGNIIVDNKSGNVFFIDFTSVNAYEPWDKMPKLPTKSELRESLYETEMLYYPKLKTHPNKPQPKSNYIIKTFSYSTKPKSKSKSKSRKTKSLSFTRKSKSSTSKNKSI